MDNRLGVGGLLLCLCVAGFVACGESSTSPSADVPAVTDTSDTITPPEDTTSPEDTTPPEDTALPEDTTPPEDTAPPEDTTPPPEDTAPPPEDTAPPEDTWQPPAFPESASAVTLADPIPAQSILLRATGATTVAAVQGERVLAQDEEGTQLLDTLWGVVQGEFEDDIGTLWETAEWGEDTLMACEDTLHVLHNGFVFESPLQTLVSEQSIHTVQTVQLGDSPSLWLGTDTGLYTWEDETLFELVPEGLPTANASVVDGGTFDGGPAVWVAAEGWLYAIVQEAESLVSVPVLDALPVTQMRVDDAQRLWLLTNGDIVLRHPDGEWEWLAFSQPVQSLVGESHSPNTWFFLSDSVVVHHDGYFRTAEGMTVPLDADMTDQGDIAAAYEDGVFRWTLDSEVPPVATSWTGHIQPLYESKCITCHTPDNIGADLSSMQLWVDNIDLIMIRVQDDMPADDPPLDPNLVALIQQWIDGGFVE
jgi:hypothetical protein